MIAFYRKDAINVDSVFGNKRFIDLIAENAKKPSVPVEDASINQLPDDITDEEIADLINEMKRR